MSTVRVGVAIERTRSGSGVTLPVCWEVYKDANDILCDVHKAHQWHPLPYNSNNTLPLSPSADPKSSSNLRQFGGVDNFLVRTVSIKEARSDVYTNLARRRITINVQGRPLFIHL